MCPPIRNSSIKVTVVMARRSTGATKLQLPPAEDRNESQIRPLALEQLQRIVTKFQERNRHRLRCGETASLHT